MDAGLPSERMLRPALRGAAIVTGFALVACGDRADSEAQPGTPVATTNTTPAAAKQQAPERRPDGMPWKPAPKELREAVGGPVRVAAKADQAQVSASGCEPGLRGGGSLVRATIDDFLMHATYRGRAEIAGEPEGPVLTGCGATWDRRASQWRESTECDGGVAPLWSYRAVTASGGGLRVCRRAGRSIGGVWIVPPRGSRWLVARRTTHSMAYRVRGPLPVRMTFVGVRLENAAPARIRFQSVTASGRLRRHEVEAYVAG